MEYCANRAFPSLDESEYLRTMGRGLSSDIGVFWTGSKVVSETITKEEVIHLRKVLGRKPIIWDNLHANDYDHQRLFLGPYSGRDPDVIPHLGGVLTNPNCEYSFNVPALFTLAAWSNCYDRESGAVRPWNPLAAAELAVPHFMRELHRSTAVGAVARAGVELSPEDRRCMEIDKVKDLASWNI